MEDFITPDDPFEGLGGDEVEKPGENDFEPEDEMQPPSGINEVDDGEAVNVKVEPAEESDDDTFSAEFPSSSSSSSSSSDDEDSTEDEDYHDDVWEHTDTTWWGNSTTTRKAAAAAGKVTRKRNSAATTRIPPEAKREESELIEFKCMECGAHIETFVDGINHMRREHGVAEEVFKCFCCGEIRESKDDLKFHVVDYHIEMIEERPFKCFKCSEQIQGFRASLDHMKQSHEMEEEEGECPCVLCPLTFEDENSLRSHLRQNHSKKSVSLQGRKKPKPPPKKKNTRKYQKSYSETTSFKCKRCDEISVGLNAFAHHNWAVHEAGLECPVCDRAEFRRKDQLRAHVQTHNENKLPCEFCGKQFADGNKMKRHISEVHEKKKNFMCNTCGRCFARKDKLRSHEATHRPGDFKPFLCEQCGKGFTRQEQVNRHKKICGRAKSKKRVMLEELAEDHPEREIMELALELGIEDLEKNPETGKYHCMACSHQFRHKRYIAEHYARNHREENLRLPYNCDECGMGFKLKKDLLAHLAKPHQESTKKKNFVCPEEGCGRRFLREFELEKHSRIHKGICDWKCDHCDAKYHIRTSLKDHMMTVHGIDLPRAPKNRKRLLVAAMKAAQNDGQVVKKKKRKRRDQPSNDNLVALIGKTNSNNALNLSQPTNSAWNANDEAYYAQQQQQQQEQQQQQQQPQSSSNVSISQWISMGLEQQQEQFSAPDDSVSVHSSQGTFEPPSSLIHPHPWHPITPELAPSYELEPCDELTVKNKSKKKKYQGAPMTEEERAAFEDDLNTKNLGSVCSVCGKVFRNKDALEFHIMTTKMAGHKILQQQRMKSKYAMESIQVASRLANQYQRKTGGFFDEEDGEKFEPYSEPEPPFDFDPSQPTIDPKTGEFVIKAESHNQAVVAPPANAEPDESDQVVEQENVNEEDILSGELPLKVDIKVEGEIEEEEEKKVTTSSKMFKCAECDKGFKKQSKLLKHVKKKHELAKPPKKKVIINEQDLLESDVSELTKDAKDATGRWSCVLCDKTLANKQKLTRHISEVHQKLRSHKCRVCNRTYARAEKLKAHEQEAHDEETLAKFKPKPAPGIPVQSSGATAVKSEATSNCPQLKLSPLGCLDCDLVFVDKDSLMAHFTEAPHNFTEDPLQEKMTCPMKSCNLTFSSFGRVVQHLKIGKHNQPCPSCGKEFRRLDKLEIHLRCHSSDRPYVCNIPNCDKTYKDPTSLQFHKKSHTGARPYVCQECGSGFVKPDHLKRHVNSTHLKIKSVKCQFCDKYFSDKYKAKIHERKHTGKTFAVHFLYMT